MVDLMPIDLQEEAIKQNLNSSVSNKQTTPTGTPSGNNFLSTCFDEIINIIIVKPLEVLERKTLRNMNFVVELTTEKQDYFTPSKNILSVLLNEVFLSKDTDLKKSTKKLK